MQNAEVCVSNHTNRSKKRPLKSKMPFDARSVTDAVFCFILSFAYLFDSITPFAISYYAVRFDRKSWFLSFSFLSLGTLIMHRGMPSFKYILMGFIFTTVMAITDKVDKTYKKALLLSLIVLFIDAAPALTGTFLVYDILIAFGEAVLCFAGVYIFSKSAKTLSVIEERDNLWPEETVSIVVFTSLVTLSFRGLPPIFGINISTVLNVLFILMTCLRGSIGMGASIGVAVGLISGIDTYDAGSIVGVYAFSSLCASLLKSYGKLGVCLGFLISNLLMTVVLSGSGTALISVYEILLACLILFLMPKSVVEVFSSITRKTELSEAFSLSNGDKVKQTLYEKLEMVSDSFKKLAFRYEDKEDKGITKKDIVNIFNSVAEKSCTKCAMRRTCYNANTEEMYLMMENMLETAKRDGYIEYRELPAVIKETCIKPDMFLNAFNTVFEIYRVNNIWRGKIHENKQLMSEQLINVSKIIDGLAHQMNVCMDRETEGRIKSLMEKQGYKPTSIMVMKYDNGHMIIDVKFDLKNYFDDTEYSIIPCICDAVGEEFQLQSTYSSGNKMCMEYRLKDKFSVTTGIARTKKYGEQVSGDNFTTMVLKDGSYIMAISDGMGSGEEADKESKATIDLLKQFLKAGFDRDTTVKLINSSLILKSDSDIFSTIDMCDVDLSLGVAEFVKIGSASTYIKSGDKVEEIKSSSLPVGILKDVQAEFYSRKVTDDTLIIMMSDGVCEADKQGGKWIEKEICEMDISSPQVAADKILEKAIFKSGQKALDDMTVVATRIQKL